MLLVLGCGYTGLAVARRRVATERVVGTTRDPARAEVLRREGLEVVADVDQCVVDAESDVVVTFPPDGVTDLRLAPRCAAARAVVYLSSTAVFGAVHGVVDDTTPVRRDSERAALRLAAEDAWRAVGATVLRAPAIYGPDRGLHVRVRAGKHRVPGDGSQFVSRVHVEDLASLVLAALARPRRETYVVGDLEPAAHGAVVDFVCAEWGCARPPHVPLEQSDETLRGDRRVDPRRALAELGVTLAYPSYRDGMRR